LPFRVARFEPQPLVLHLFPRIGKRQRGVVEYQQLAGGRLARRGTSVR